MQRSVSVCLVTSRRMSKSQNWVFVFQLANKFFFKVTVRTWHFLMYDRLLHTLDFKALMWQVSSMDQIGHPTKSTTRSSNTKRGGSTFWPMALFIISIDNYENWLSSHNAVSSRGLSWLSCKRHIMTPSVVNSPLLPDTPRKVTKENFSLLQIDQQYVTRTSSSSPSLYS